MKKKPILIGTFVLWAAALATVAGVGLAANHPAAPAANPADGLTAMTVASTPAPQATASPQDSGKPERHERVWDEDAKAKMEENLKARIEQAVTDGTLTRGKADEILKALEDGNLNSILDELRGLMPGKGLETRGGMGSGGKGFGFRGPMGGGMFSGDYYEQNQDKTLKELRGEWLAELKTQLDEAVASGKMTQAEADEAYQNAQDGKGFGPCPGKRGGSRPSFGDSQSSESNASATSVSKL